MSGRPYSYYSNAGSAADAYNTAATSNNTSGAAGGYSAQDPESYGGTGVGMFDSRPTHSNGYAMANDHDDDEDEDWNVYDDFNMTRPLSSAPVRGGLQTQHEGYWDASTPGSESKLETPYTDYPQRKSLLNSEAFGFDVRNADPRNVMAPTNQRDSNNRLSMLSTGTGLGQNRGVASTEQTSGIELITVPALGAEFTKEEIKDMTRKSKKKKKRSARKKRFGTWMHGDDHLWGWLSPRVAVFMAFIFFILLGVTLFFVIPRVPVFAFNSTTPVDAVPDGASMVVNRSPTNFSMTMDLNLRADNMGGWIPSKATDLKVKVSDLSTNARVGEGEMASMTFPGRKKTVFKFPVDFFYRSANVTGDTTFLNFYNACGYKYPNTPRPSLNLGVQLTMKIQGLVGRKGTYTSITNIECPFQLQRDQ